MKVKKGQAVVETALVIPLLLLLLSMIVDTGRIIYAESRLNSICQESVRIAGLGGKDLDVQNYAVSQLDSTVTAVEDPPDNVRKSGDFVTVTLNYNLNYITPFANVILPSPYKAIAKSTIRVE